MVESRAASRYVKSLLDLSVERGVLEQVHSDMVTFLKISRENRDFSLMLKSPVIRHDKKRVVLEKLFSGRVNALTMAFFDIITKKNREPLLPQIAKEFHDAYNSYKGIGKASVITSQPLDAGLRFEFEKMAKVISKRDHVELIEKVDNTIIGGFILDVGDKQIDASIKNKLKRLKLELMHNPYIKEF